MDIQTDLKKFLDEYNSIIKEVNDYKQLCKNKLKQLFDIQEDFDSIMCGEMVYPMFKAQVGHIVAVHRTSTIAPNEFVFVQLNVEIDVAVNKDYSHPMTISHVPKDVFMFEELSTGLSLPIVSGEITPE